MRELDDQELLALWEGQRLQPLNIRSVSILAAVYPEISYEEVSKMSIGGFDNLLMNVYETYFGHAVQAQAKCPKCNEDLDVNFNINDIRTTFHPNASEPIAFNSSGYQIAYKVPSVNDILKIERCQDPNTAMMNLLQCCITSAKRDGMDITLDGLPSEVLRSISDEMEKSDPQADIRLSLICSECSNQWQEVFDIGTFLWSKIDKWAKKTMMEVHNLAMAYGWSEAEVLNISSYRRRIYLELVS